MVDGHLHADDLESAVSRQHARTKIQELRKSIGRRRRCTSLRLCLCLLAAAAVCALQLLLFASWLPAEEESSDATAGTVVEPVAMPAVAAADDEIDEFEPPMPPPSSLAAPPPVQGVTQWALGPPTHRAVRLHGCMGKGTYGATLNASLPGVGTVVLKLPVLRHWGFRFHRAEARALEALEASVAGGGASIRNVVRTFGNTTVGVRWLLRLATSDKMIIDGEVRQPVLHLWVASLCLCPLPAPLTENSRAQDWVSTDDARFGRGSEGARSDVGDVGGRLDEPMSARWGCLNGSDLQHALDLGAHTLPVLLLEPLEDISVFKWLAGLAAPANAENGGGVDVTAGGAAASQLALDAQRRLFRSQIEAAKAPASPPLLRDALHHGLILLTGVAHGLNAIHRARVLHRDLTEPGKNALLKRDSIGLTAAMIDFSQADVCAVGKGAAGRAIDLYSYGKL